MKPPLVDMDEVFETIREKYAVIRTPCSNFFAKVVRRRPYADAIHDLMQDCFIREDTDLNYDVSFGYEIIHEEKFWYLQISMLGPFAVLMRKLENGSLAVIVPETADPCDELLCETLGKFSIALMSQEQLETPVDIEFDYMDQEDVRVYQAAFTSLETFPWGEYTEANE